MTRNFQTLDLLILSCCCFFFTIEILAGEVLPPRNVSLVWADDVYPLLSWEPPQQLLENCAYKAVLFDSKGDSERFKRNETHWKIYRTTEGGFWNLSIATSCNNMESERVHRKINEPELVKDLQCYIHSPKETHCSWIQASHAQDVHFFYQLTNEDGSTPAAEESPSRLHLCPSYIYSDGARTGCDLEAKVTQDVHILFNGTLNNKTVRNTFRKELQSNMRPPPLKWNVTKEGHKFIISWSPPEFFELSAWTFTINYTECNEIKSKDESGETFTVLNLVPHCPYRMAIKGFTDRGETPWSEEKHFNAETDQNTLVYAVIIIPLMFAGLAALTLVCYRKNKDSIFPKVPEPVDLLSDISDNNNKSTFCNLYIPSEEEQSCKITLVTDSKN